MRLGMCVDVVAPCDNLISKDPDGFLARGLLQPVMNIFRKVLLPPLFLAALCCEGGLVKCDINILYLQRMLDANFPEEESGEMCKIVEIVLFYCKGKVDNIVSQQAYILTLAHAHEPTVQ